MNEATYSVSADDFVAAQRLHFRRSWSWKRVAVPVGSLGALLALFYVADGGSFDLTLFVSTMLPIIVMIGIIFLVAWISIPISARRTWSQRRTWNDIHISWNTDGISFKSDRGDGQYGWRDFYRWSADRTSLLLYLDGRMFFVLPIRAVTVDGAESIKQSLTLAGIKKQ
jgi:hypothetical protein